MAKRKNKKWRRITAVVLIVVLVLIILFTCDMKALAQGDIKGAFAPWRKYLGIEEKPQTQVVAGDVNIHFLELGNANTGDCTLIDVGNTEVLIDAGSKRNSASTVVNYIKSYCEDGVLEYVIATHAHEDHIAAFVGNTNNKTDGVFDNFEVGTIIDYTQRNTTSQISKDYEALRDSLVAKGTKHYTALDCWQEKDGAKRSYTLGEGITMNILYQKYYEQSSGDENEYSVCMLLNDGKNNYLFTGDLESKGEQSLVEENDLPKCKLFKGGHHGSPTSSTLNLLKVIQPEIVCVCCCCGSTEYTDNMNNVFPSQAFVDRVAAYTSQIYVTTMISADGKSGISMNGNIIVSSRSGVVSVNCSNNNTVFKETAWFKQYRTWPKSGK